MKIKFSTTNSDGSVIVFTAPVVANRIKDRAPWVKIPERVRRLPFPPFNGKRFVLINPDYASKWTI